MAMDAECDIPGSIEEMTSCRRRLGLVFDIDGTLILERPGGDQNNDDSDDGDIILRRGSMEFLHWCKHERGHSIALWTAASEDHLNRCLQVFCPLITNHNNNDCDGDGGTSSCGRCSGGSTSCGPHCRKSFDFAWSRSKLKQQQTLFCTNTAGGDDRSDGCRWCKSYHNSCTRCRCHFYTYACPCMNVKDLKKVWKWSSSSCSKDGTSSSSVFTKERTIMIENTPQQCINNYGNAIYVPTFYGLQQDEPIENVREAWISHD